MADDKVDEFTGVEGAGDEGYQFDDADSTSEEKASKKSSKKGKSDEPADEGASDDTQGDEKSGGQGGSKGGDRKFADEIFSKTIQAKFRTFYIDLKESSNGKFVKISEKSRGRKSTIMMDAEDVPSMIEALQEVEKQL
jgi:hypothetical protein